MHKDSLTDNILSMINNTDYNLHRFSLVCSEITLRSRLQKDIDDGVRKNVSWNHALSTRPNFDEMDTIKIDVNDITPEQAAYTIYNSILREST